jgi:hypothetical protein
MTFIFIHVTKSGGTALEDYFQKHYNSYITGYGHEKHPELFKAVI